MKTIIPTAVLQEVMDAMDDMATDSRLLEMKQSRVHQFDAARDALRAALEQPQRKLTQRDIADSALLGNIESPFNACMHQEHCKAWKEKASAGTPATADLTDDQIIDLFHRKTTGLGRKGIIAFARAMFAAAPQPQSDATPYLYYDPENGDTWTQEAVNDGCCLPDGLIALYTK